MEGEKSANEAAPTTPNDAGGAHDVAPPKWQQHRTGSNHRHHYNQRERLDPSLSIESQQQELDQKEEQQQNQASNKPPSSRMSGHRGGSAKLAAHRSQSSPSSLTTHKFGLRPTPSPPRLIIDHQTGDIIESYPERPVYLRTYQPVEEGAGSEAAGSVSSQLSSQSRQPNDTSSALELSLAESSFLNDTSANQPSPCSSAMRQANSNIIPPPHAANRVYFGPASGQQRTISRQANLSAEDHQLSPDDEDDEHQMAAGERRRPTTGSSRHRAPPEAGASSMKRALHKLDYGNHPQLLSSPSKTDIAFVTAPENRAAGPLVPTLNITTTRHQLAKMADAPIEQELPPIESFKLYNFCFNLRLFATILVSGLIIYLLLKPLNLDCLTYRPTYAYVSVIVASVNLTCVLVFSLFWWCSGVTRALYANLSSSAFIVTIYSILVALNLALAITFFFTNTCHYQRLLHSRPAAQVRLIGDTTTTTTTTTTSTTTLSLLAGNGPEALVWPRANLEDAEARLDALEASRFEGTLVSEQDELNLNKDNFHQGNSRRASTLTRRETLHGEDELGSAKLGNLHAIAVAADDDDDQDDQDEENGSHNDPDQEYDLEHDDRLESGTPSMSPIEAAWLYVKERAAMLRVHFRRFLAKYDLRFIGSLHAICAICLQYLAIKVAVVRSCYSSAQLVATGYAI